jgi:pimeloyl-ACP methyl ester carboxylesterase
MARLVLLPGMDGTGLLFDGLIEALGPGQATQVVAYPADIPMGYEALDALVRRQLPDDVPFFLLAESFSGPIGISIAADPPPNLQGLILCCTFAGSPLPALDWLGTGAVETLFRLTPEALIGEILMGGFSTPSLRAALKGALAAVKPRVLAHRATAALAVDRTAALGRIRLPVLDLRASHDRVVPAAAGHVIKACLPHARVRTIHAPHFLLQSRPQDAAREITAFMAAAPSADSR